MQDVAGEKTLHTLRRDDEQEEHAKGDRGGVPVRRTRPPGNKRSEQKWCEFLKDVPPPVKSGLSGHSEKAQTVEICAIHNPIDGRWGPRQFPLKPKYIIGL